tara:strand:- start:619 stop:1272 length:654 start_codon:yes stop_codon:yes gene_type:complete
LSLNLINPHLKFGAAGVEYDVDLSSSTGWTQVGTQVTVDTASTSIKAVNATNASDQRVYYDLTGSSAYLNNETWIMRYTYNRGASGWDAGAPMFLATTTGSTTGTAQILGMWQGNGHVNAFYSNNGSHAYSTAINIGNATTWYIELIRQSSTSLELKVYSDSAYSSLTGSQTLSVPAFINLRYLQSSTTQNGGTQLTTYTISGTGGIITLKDGKTSW